MAKKNKNLSWKIEYVIFRSIETLFRVLPLSWCYRFGSLLGLLSRLIIKKRRRAVERNLRIAYGNTKSQKEIDQLAKKVFQHNGGNLLASIKTATMSAEAVEKCLTIEGAEQLQQFVKDNNGAIILLPHMGNWEVGARLNEIVYGELTGGGMYRPLDNPHLDKLVKQRREDSGSKLFARSDGMAAPLQFIRENGILAILADQRVGKTGQLTPFFGRVTSFSPLPQIYKKRTKCGLIGLAIITTAPGKWTIKYTFEADKNTDVNTADIASIMERIMRLSPADCFWMQDRWRLEERPLFIAGKPPILAPVLSGFSLNQQQFAIYLDTFEKKHLIALEQLAQHRPDIELTCFTSSEPQASSRHFKTRQCPHISSTREFNHFFNKLDQEYFTDLLLVPLGHEASLQKRIEGTHTRIHALDSNELLQSLKEAGLQDPLSMKKK